MNETEIRKYAALMKELELTGIEIDESRGYFRLECEAPKIVAAPTATPIATPAAPTKESYHTVSVKSPMIGVYYEAPAENAEPFVKVGDYVHKGDVLCIVEAMKLMNEIVAEHDGTIEEICVSNGQLIEYGTELFHIKEMDA